MPSLLILIPLAGVVLLNLLPKRSMRAAAFWFAFILFCTQLIIAVFHSSYFYDAPQGALSSLFAARLFVDSLTFIALVCIEIVCLASLIVMRGTLTDGDQRFNFVNLLLIASIGMNGLVMTRDVFSLYVFLEITTVASVVLIALRRGKASLEGAFKYIMLSAVATMLLLIAISIFVCAAGDTGFFAIRDALTQSQGSSFLMFATALFLTGAFIKSGMFPFHGWLPDAYSSAPSAVSVLLAGIVTKICGIYVLMRFVVSVCPATPQLHSLLLFVGAVSVLAGATAAIGQKGLKRMLAYSSISQMGYIIMGVGCGTSLGMICAAFHFFNHALFKTLLFVNAAAVTQRFPRDDMDAMGGLAQKMPVTGATSVIGFLSAAGVPPLSGFWSKLLIVFALFSAGHYAFAAIAALAGALTLGYFLIMQRKVFFGVLKEGLDTVREAEFGISALAIVLACIIVGCGIYKK